MYYLRNLHGNAIVYCEGKYADFVAKTAHGLVRYSKRFKILGVVDSSLAGMDAGEVLDGRKRGIPIFASVADAVNAAKDKGERIHYMIIGVATIGGRLPEDYREGVKEAIRHGINIIAGLHEFLADDEEFSQLAEEYGVRIHDIRREPPLHMMHNYRNLAPKIRALRLVVMGTDSSIGKRTVAIELTSALAKRGYNAVFVATGQTGLLQGAKYGVPLDSIQGDYMVGELENAIYEAYINEKPDVIIVEGQGSISHPAYVCGSRAILSAAKPHGVILQHAPKREYRHYGLGVLNIPMPDLEREIEMIEMFSESRVIAITINHEGMDVDEVEDVVAKYEEKYGVPVCDVLMHGCGKIVGVIESMLRGIKG